MQILQSYNLFVWSSHPGSTKSMIIQVEKCLLNWLRIYYLGLLFCLTKTLEEAASIYPIKQWQLLLQAFSTTYTTNAEEEFHKYIDLLVYMLVIKNKLYWIVVRGILVHWGFYDGTTQDSLVSGEERFVSAQIIDFEVFWLSDFQSCILISMLTIIM